MRIVIDMQGAQTESRFRGIGRYSLSLALALVSLANKQHQFYLALNGNLTESIDDIREAFRDILQPDHIRIFDVPALEHVHSWHNLSAEIVREDFLSNLKPDVVLLTSVFEGHWTNAVTSIGAHSRNIKTAAVLYDLIPLIYPDNYLIDPELKYYYYRKLEWVKNAHLLLAISDSSRYEAIELLNIKPEHVVNISTAIGNEFKVPEISAEESKEILARFSIFRNMILYAPGGFDHRKNFDRLIKSYSKLPQSLRDVHQLVIVSKINPQQRSELADIALNNGLKHDDLILTGYVEDNVLIKLYALAKLFVFPSLHEGFGLPVLEAMACGAPVVGSKTTSLPEVIGLDEALFDPNSTESMTQMIAYALTNESFRERLLNHSKMHVQKFNWDRCAKSALEAIERLHQQPFTHLEEKTLVDALAHKFIDTNASDENIKFVSSCIAFNQGSHRRQLLLDISTLVHSDAKSGIQRVVRSLVNDLITREIFGFDVRPIFFDINCFRYANSFCKEKYGAASDLEDSTIDFSQDDIYLSLDLNMHLSEAAKFLHQSMHYRGMRQVFIVYDILLTQQPQWWSKENEILFLQWLSNIGDLATDLVCISKTVAHDVSKWFEINSPNRKDFGPKIHYFHLGADVKNSLPSQGIPFTSNGIFSALKARSSFLMVGTVEPRKGHAQVLQAFEILWRQNIEVNLFIVGNRGWLVDSLIDCLVHHVELGNRLFWLEGASDEYLEKVYSASTCLLTASYGEGFGLPLIEAAHRKLPVIARDIPVFREVAGRHAFYFSAAKPEELAVAIEQWLSLYAKNQHPRSDNMPWLTWKESATQLLSTLGIQTQPSTLL